jgi:hypothetical protein
MTNEQLSIPIVRQRMFTHSSDASLRHHMHIDPHAKRFRRSSWRVRERPAIRTQVQRSLADFPANFMNRTKKTILDVESKSFHVRGHRRAAQTLTEEVGTTPGSSEAQL